MPTISTSLDLVQALDSVEVAVSNVVATDRSFQLTDVVPKRVEASGKILINWYRFDEVDELDLTVLATFFDDVWYPASDDIDIFDHGFTWAVSVRHDGIVKKVDFFPK